MTINDGPFDWQILRRVIMIKNWKKILLIIAASGVVTVLLLGAYGLYLTNELFIPLKEFERDQSYTLDANALVNREEMKTYYAFTEHDLDFDFFKKDYLQTEGVGGNEFLIKEDLKLGASAKNSCETYRCLQFPLDLSNMSSFVWKALIATEDQRFLEHSGLDPKSILRAVVKDIKALAFVEGGSTLTQQLVKNLFFTNEKSLIRKFKEAIAAVVLEIKYSKEKLLEAYLNNVWWGSVQNIRLKGIYAASVGYFHKHPRFITPYESAILISMLKGPYYYSPLKHIDRLRERSDFIFGKLKELEFISDDTPLWDDKNWKVFEKRILSFNQKTYLSAYYSLSEFDLSDYPYYVAINGALKVLKRYQKDNKSVAVKFYIKNLKTDRNFFYYSKLERSHQDARTKERHQIGSLLKPLAYKEYILVGDREFDYEVSTEEITLDLKSGKWTPRDSESEKEWITLLEALRKSKNRPLIRLARDHGFDKLEQAFIAKYNLPLQLPLSEFPAQLLGAIELNFEQIMNTYTAFFKDECQRLGEAEEYKGKSVMWQLSFHDESTIRKVSDERLKETNFFGKTGTTNRGRDNWFLSFDGKDIMLIWFGAEDLKESERLIASGATTAFKIFENYFLYRGKSFPELELCKE